MAVPAIHDSIGTADAITSVLLRCATRFRAEAFRVVGTRTSQSC